MVSDCDWSIGSTSHAQFAASCCSRSIFRRLSSSASKASVGGACPLVLSCTSSPAFVVGTDSFEFLLCCFGGGACCLLLRLDDDVEEEEEEEEGCWGAAVGRSEIREGFRLIVRAFAFSPVNSFTKLGVMSASGPNSAATRRPALSFEFRRPSIWLKWFRKIQYQSDNNKNDNTGRNWYSHIWAVCCFVCKWEVMRCRIDA